MSHFARFGVGIGLTPAHLAFGVTTEAMRINGNGQEPAGEMSDGPPQLAQGDLKALRLGLGVGGQQFVDGGVGGGKGQAVGQLEAFLTEGATGPQIAGAQSRFVDKLETAAPLPEKSGLA